VELNAEDGIGLVEASHDNEVSSNTSRLNTLSGILLDNADFNLILSNDVHDNVVAGIRLTNGSNSNTVSGNLIQNNGDGLTNLVQCLGDLTGNMGTNVPATPACQ
jgi:parallel beta-helix repeat protein